MESIPVISLGAAAFWIALAAVLIANGINRVRREKLRQETLLKLVEKTGRLDEQTVKALFPPPAPHVFSPPPRQPDGRRGTKIFGTIMLSIAVGIAIFITIITEYGPPQMQDPIGTVIAYAVAALVACLGIGLFVAARFVRPPADERDRETS